MNFCIISISYLIFAYRSFQFSCWDATVIFCSLIEIFSLSEPYCSNSLNCHCLAFKASDQVSCCFCIYLHHLYLQYKAIMMVFHFTTLLYLLASHVTFWDHAYGALTFENFFPDLSFSHLRHVYLLFQDFSQMLWWLNIWIMLIIDLFKLVVPYEDSWIYDKEYLILLLMHFYFHTIIFAKFLKDFLFFDFYQ